jgi:hypothetical protein
MGRVDPVGDDGAAGHRDIEVADGDAIPERIPGDVSNRRIEHRHLYGRAEPGGERIHRRCERHRPWRLCASTHRAGEKNQVCDEGRGFHGSRSTWMNIW